MAYLQGNEIKKITVIIKKKKIITGWLSLVYRYENWHCRVEVTTQSVCLPNKHENLSSDPHSRHNKLRMALCAWNPGKGKLWGWEVDVWKLSDLPAWPLWQSSRCMRDPDSNKRYPTPEEWQLRLPSVCTHICCTCLHLSTHKWVRAYMPILSSKQAHTDKIIPNEGYCQTDILKAYSQGFTLKNKRGATIFCAPNHSKTF